MKVWPVFVLCCLLVGCGRGGEKVTGAKGAVETGTGQMNLEPEPKPEWVGNSWVFDDLIVFYSPELGKAVGIRADSEKGLVVFPILDKTDYSGFSDVAVHGDKMAMATFDASGDADLFMLRGLYEPEVVWGKSDVLIDAGSLLFSSDGDKIAVGDSMGNIFVWQSANGAKVWEKVYDIDDLGSYNHIYGDGQLLLGKWANDGVELVDPFGQKSLGTFDHPWPFWRKGRLVCVQGNELVDFKTLRPVLSLETDVVLDLVSPDTHYLFNRPQNKKYIDILDLETGKQITRLTAQGESSIRQGFVNWGRAFVMNEGECYKLYDLDRPDYKIWFWPVWEVSGDEYSWFIKTIDGRWAGSLEAARERGMTREADSGLVEEFGELVGLK